ncbi:MAG: DUF4147 domain-containing protein [Chthonomonadales bacterium]|nr:DUF4147 domain-containing protein [Chthonomonadales bacterium]
MSIEARCPAARSHVSQDALAVYTDALRAVSADRLIAEHVVLAGQQLRVGAHLFDLGEVRRVLVVGAGKASGPMVQAMERVLGSRLAGGIAVTKHGHGVSTDRVRLLEAGHPVPDDASIQAGRAIAELADEAESDDLVIVLISGGASALMELPAEGVTLEDIQATSRALLACGATINEINAVRARISRIKAGGLARLIAPARSVCLVLSDVLGSPLAAIGSGPCMIESGSAEAAGAVLDKYGLWDQVPASVRSVAVESPRLPGVETGCEQPPHVIIGDIHTALNAAYASAQRRGYRPIVVTSWLQGEAREVALTLAGAARDLPELRRREGITCLLFGGETTVTIRGDGLGGRCQEIGVAAMSVLEGVNGVVLLAAGTDGTDGPTDAAGALVDGQTADRVAAAGLSATVALSRSDTHPLLDRIGALIRTGPTGTNVGDLVIAMLS